MRNWIAELPRIRAMGFDWIFVNAFHYPGFSGSLYAVKDYYRLNPLFNPEGVESADEVLQDFTAAAEAEGVRVIMDLVINHTSKDALLAERHPDWYRRNPDGSLYSPRAIDPDDPGNATIWGDLAELDYDSPPARAGLAAHWKSYIDHYARLGFRGFRCDAAYKVPSEVWRELIGSARANYRDVTFFAETLGCTKAEVEALRPAGFDYLFNSSKWWDFRANWLLQHYDEFRSIAPSIAFPESHDTPRLAAEMADGPPERLAAYLKMRYLFAACFSSGVMLPIGYEYGFTRPLDVVGMRPTDWENNRLDLSGYIAAVNAMKAAVPALNVEGAQRRITAPDSPVTGLLRLLDGVGSGACAISLINPDAGRTHGIDGAQIFAASGGEFDSFVDVTPQAEPKALLPGQALLLEPLEMRVFRGDMRLRKPVRVNRAGTKAAQKRLEELARDRVIIEGVYPELDGGRFPVKREVGDVLEVWADIFCDGHASIGAALKYREAGERDWRETPMQFHDNDRWFGRVPLTRNCRMLYTIEAWIDEFQSWRLEVIKKRDAGQDLQLESIEGRHLVTQAVVNADPADRALLEEVLGRFADAKPDVLLEQMLSSDVHAAMRRAAPRAYLSRYKADLELIVDRTAARFGAWYELFPRSTAGDAGRHGTFADVIRHLPYVSGMGFDVMYFPPIHPVGQTNKKGRNNALEPAHGDPGSVYAIGSAEGGHAAVHPELGTLDDFRKLVASAREHGLEIAIDFAIQCSPDHPWIKAHPEWFEWRPDGSIRYAENPPKKYEDIVNVQFYGAALPAVWLQWRDVVLFWLTQGVRIFRVDNPHTKPAPFWEWLIREVQDRDPGVIFLSEAFTRPKMMKRLAKLGFTQSYSYFTWRNTKQELTGYLTELTQSEAREYMRPNFFVNTPDINPFYLQTSGRPGFQVRAVLAGTLSSVWGMYSSFELCEARPIPGREEYIDSDKYELKDWDFDRPGNIRDYIARLNRIRRDNPALHEFLNLRFYPAHDDAVLFYGKTTPMRDNIILVAVNLDPHGVREPWIELPLHEFNAPEDGSIEVQELFSGKRHRFNGRHQQLRLDPQHNPCMIWRVTPAHPTPEQA